MKSKSVFVNGFVNNVPAKYILIDSGSTVTVISEVLWNASRSENDKCLPIAGKFLTANGTPLQVLGKAKLRFHIAGLDVLHTVIAAKNVTQHCLLACLGLIS